MREHGWEEGRNIVIEGPHAGGDPARFPELAAELVALKVEVIIVANTQSAQAAQRSTATIPIIIANIAGPVRSGLVASLARPGGNITGLTNQFETVPGKNLELLKEIVPSVRCVAIQYSPNNAPSVRTFESMQAEVGPRLGLVPLPIPVSKLEDFADAFASIIREQAELINCSSDAARVRASSTNSDRCVLAAVREENMRRREFLAITASAAIASSPTKRMVTVFPGRPAHRHTVTHNGGRR